MTLITKMYVTEKREIKVIQNAKFSQKREICEP